MDNLIVLMMEIFRAYLLEIHWYILIVKLLDLIKASNWDLPMVKFFGTILGNVDRITLGIDIGNKLVFVYGYFDGYN